MRFESPPRAAHRATAGGGLALLVKGAGPVGQHRPVPVAMGAHARPRPQRRAPREPQRAAQMLSHGIAAMIVFGLVTMVGMLVLGGDRRVPGATAAPAAGLLGSRADDPAPLGLQEVFPAAAELRVGDAAYRVTMTHVDADCRSAATGALGPVLQEHGCSQVVRAGLVAPYGDYEVTAGVANLADATGAMTVDGRLRELVETGDGSFAAMGSGRPGAEPTPPATSQVGWHAVGHYLLYCVITRPDGQLVTADDPYAAQITAELVDAYLGASVLGRRASGA